MLPKKRGSFRVTSALTMNLYHSLILPARQSVIQFDSEIDKPTLSHPASKTKSQTVSQSYQLTNKQVIQRAHQLMLQLNSQPLSQWLITNQKKIGSQKSLWTPSKLRSDHFF